MLPVRARPMNQPVFPRLRWGVLVWLAVWVPTYAVYNGPRNFLQLCDVGVFLTCLGLWRGDARLLSSQAVGTMVINALWAADAGARLLTGGHLFGGTEYLWDGNKPLFVRLLSLFHLGLPPLLLWSLRRTGYDRRGLPLMVAIAGAVLALSRLVGDPAGNMNFAFREPFTHRALGPGPVHLLVSLAALSAGAFWPTHRLLARFLPKA